MHASSLFKSNFVRLRAQDMMPLGRRFVDAIVNLMLKNDAKKIDKIFTRRKFIFFSTSS